MTIKIMHERTTQVNTPYGVSMVCEIQLPQARFVPVDTDAASKSPTEAVARLTFLGAWRS